MFCENGLRRLQPQTRVWPNWPPRLPTWRRQLQSAAGVQPESSRTPMVKGLDLANYLELAVVVSDRQNNGTHGVNADNALRRGTHLASTRHPSPLSGPSALHSDQISLLRPMRPNHSALGFTMRLWVLRSTAINPNFGAYPNSHSKLSSSDQ